MKSTRRLQEEGSTHPSQARGDVVKLPVASTLPTYPRRPSTPQGALPIIRTNIVSCSLPCVLNTPFLSRTPTEPTRSGTLHHGKCLPPYAKSPVQIFTGTFSMHSSFQHGLEYMYTEQTDCSHSILPVFSLSLDIEKSTHPHTTCNCSSISHASQFPFNVHSINSHFESIAPSRQPSSRHLLAQQSILGLDGFRSPIEKSVSSLAGP